MQRQPASQQFIASRHFETVTELLIATNSTEYRTEAMQSLDVNRRIPDTQEYSKKRANKLVTTDIAH